MPQRASPDSPWLRIIAFRGEFLLGLRVMYSRKRDSCRRFFAVPSARSNAARGAHDEGWEMQVRRRRQLGSRSDVGAKSRGRVYPFGEYRSTRLYPIVPCVPPFAKRPRARPRARAARARVLWAKSAPYFFHNFLLGTHRRTRARPSKQKPSGYVPSSAATDNLPNLPSRWHNSQVVSMRRTRSARRYTRA